MSKMLRTAGMVVAAVALVATTAGMALPAVAAAGTAAGSAGGIAGVASAATLSAIGAYGGLAAAALTTIAGATAPGLSSQGSATDFTTNPQSGLPYAMGRTRMSGLRFFAATNTRPGYTKFNDLLWFGALLSIGGQIDSIEKFTADSEVVTFDASGNAIGDFRDYMGQKVHLGGPMSTALNLSLGGGTAPGWTTAHKLSGITHAMWCLRYNKQGEMYGAGAPEPAWIGKWVKVYDPRLDSTYPGGSGPCRALDETTYVWSDNPGLHALTWALGRWQNGKRTCGIGAPVETIRMAEFVECANVCDANGWKVGGVEWTTDSKWDTLKRILQAGGARPTQTAAMIGCLVNTPRTAIATIESWHLHDGLSLAATKSRRERFNTVIPRYVDEDSDWSVISGTAVTVTEYVTADRGQRTKEIDFPLVQVFAGQEAKQPGQLAAYEIVNSREAGPWTFTTGPEWIGLKTGDVVYLNAPEEGLVNQPVMITRRAIDPSTGKVSFAVETETYSKHAYALGESTTPPAPVTLSAPELKAPAPAETEWTVTGTTSGEGFPALLVAGESEMPSADAIVIDYRLNDDDDWTNSAIVSAAEPVRHVIAPLESQTPYDVRICYRIGTIVGNATVFENVVTGVGKITIIEGQIEEQDAALAQLDEDTKAAALAAAAAQALAQQIQSSVTADIGALTTEIGTVSANLADLTSEVGTVSASLSDLSSEVGTVSANLADLTTQVGTVTANIGDLADAVTAAGGRIDTIQTTLGQQGASITSLQTTVSNHTGTLAQHTSQISAANASISTNATAISTANQNIASLTTRVGTAESSISQQATAITGLTGRTASLETSLTSQGASITSLQTTTSTLSGNLAEYQLRLSSNSPNLLPNSTGEAGLRGYSGAGSVWSVISSISNAPYFLCMPSGAGTFVLASDPIAVEAGAPLTISYETQNSGATGVSCYVDVFCYDASGNTLLDGSQNAATGATNWGDRANRAVSFTTPANTATMRVRLVASATATTDRIRVRRIKLERGTTWSAWSSEASIAQSFSAITTAETSLASLTTTVSTQGAAVSSQATAITNLTGRTASLETSVSSQGASITSLQSTTSTQGGDIASLKTQMSTANANISTNATAITTTNQNLASLTTRVSSAESSITSQATAITGLTGRTASLETLVSSQGASITSLQTTTSTLSGNVATLTTQVSAGNPNLLPNGSGENGKTGWTGANFTVASDANGTYFTATANGTYTLQSDSFQVWANGNYTISAGFGFLATGGTVYLDMLFLNASGNSVLDGPENPQAPGRAAFGATGADRRVIAVTATAPATAVRAVARFVVNGATGMTYAAVRQIKVEAGSLATPYSAEASITQSMTSLTTLNSQYASLSTTVGTQGTTISSQATAITNLTGRTASLETSVSSQGASITSLQSATSTQGGDIATLKTQMSTANANISTNATAITTTNQNLASLTTRVSSAESSITSQATAITGLTGRTASLETTVSSQGASISSLQTTTSTIAGNVAALTTQVSAGNPNLLPNGGFENGGAGWSGTNFSFYAAGANGAYAVCNSNGTNSISSDKFAVWPSTTYTISGSFGFVGSGAGVVYLDMIFYNASGAVVLDSAQSPVGQNVKPAFVSDGSDRKLIAMAVTSPATAVTAAARFVVEGATGISYAAVRQIKVEQGAIATPYSAEASAIQSFTALSTLTTQYASLSTTVSTQGVTVSQQQTAISSLNGTVGMLYGRAAMMVTIGSDGVSRAYGIEVNGTQLGGGIDIHGDYFRVTKPGGGKRMEYTGDALRLYADNGVAVIEMTV